MQQGYGNINKALCVNGKIVMKTSGKMAVSKIINSFIFVSALSARLMAATIWCNPENTGAENGLSEVTGYNTLREAIASMAGGDTIVISSGDWTACPGMSIEHPYLPPSGSPGAYTKIHAKSDWETRVPYISDQGVGRSYVEIRGIVFDSRLNPTSHVVVDWHHTKFIRCGFLCGKVIGNNHCAGFGSADSTRATNQYNLMEECMAWGGGRYMFYCKYGKYNIFRRCIARHDYHDGGGGQDDGQIFNFRAYACDYTIYQNCISLDSDRVENFSSLQSEAGGFWIGDSYGAEGNAIFGSISIRDVHLPYYVCSNGTGTAVMDNCVALDVRVPGYTTLTAFILKSNSGLDVSHFLGLGGLGTGFDGFYGKNLGSFTVKNSILRDVAEYGILGVADNSYINHYNAGIGTFGTGSTTYDPLANGLKYPLRIETGLPLASAGENGYAAGPAILKKIGIAETLYGEQGWDEITGESIWPFPNENRVKLLMQQTVDGISTNAGFCANGTGLYGGPLTLTSYIWEYLGNPCPADICSGTYDNVAPSSPSGLTIE
ncbi:MAG: hypothetical protein A2314_05240 [Elusimicrobia bacterium RIFOXYB2_FULL_50_12]|nr:MAG: hypothetical protein A2314_05240 [Elusimicrobia bacterium RIFOXYB2_FULL_50_12]